MTVGLVFVSHSAGIAAGLVELAAQMAPDVAMQAAGGTDDGGIGTSFDRVVAAIERASSGSGVVVIGDLGSAILAAETAVDLLEPPPAGGVRVLDVPLVEGGVAAAVAAQSGATLDGVVAAAGGADPASGPDETEAHDEVAGADVVLVDPEGLHARPAAALVRLAAGFDARVTVDGADARSLLAVLAKGLRAGSTVYVGGEGPDAASAVAAVVELLGGRP